MGFEQGGVQQATNDANSAQTPIRPKDIDCLAEDWCSPSKTKASMVKLLPRASVTMPL